MCGMMKVIVFLGYWISLGSAVVAQTASPMVTPPEPFRIIFKVRDGDIFQVNTVDKRQPSAFLRVGDFIPNTNLKIEKASILQPSTERGGIDNSELTIRDVKTNKTMVIRIG